MKYNNSLTLWDRLGGKLDWPHLQIQELLILIKEPSVHWLCQTSGVLTLFFIAIDFLYEGSFYGKCLISTLQRTHYTPRSCVLIWSNGLIRRSNIFISEDDTHIAVKTSQLQFVTPLNWAKVTVKVKSEKMVSIVSGKLAFWRFYPMILLKDYNSGLMLNLLSCWTKLDFKL